MLLRNLVTVTMKDTVLKDIDEILPCFLNFLSELGEDELKDVHALPLSSYKFHENWKCERCTLLKDLNNFFFFFFFFYIFLTIWIEMFKGDV
jgi:hypothetical protein